MWTLNKVKARNICSFGSMEHKVRQGVASLIFGENEDDGENQQHNGSGKSSFIECIAFGITGEAFRKVDTIEDIIRDDEDYAEVTLDFLNKESGMVLEIYRRIERGESQKVTVRKTLGDKIEDVPFVSVLEMNKRIYDLLGISKDDLYHNYLLNENRFKSFFSSSDKEKKEIINTFSNGIIVDEAIEKLKLDMDRIDVDEMMPARSECARIDGAIDAIRQQIEEAENSQESEEKNRKERIQSLKEKIADRRADSRKKKEDISDFKKKADMLDECAGKIEALDKADMSVPELGDRIGKLFNDAGMEYGSNWGEKADELHQSKDALMQKEADMAVEFQGAKAKLDKSSVDLNESGAEYNTLKKKYDASNKDDEEELALINKEISEYEEKYQKIDNRLSGLVREYESIGTNIVVLSNAINGAVECPKCHHRFTLDGNKTVDELSNELEDKKARKAELEGEKSKAVNDKKGVLEDIDNCKLDIKDIQQDIRRREDKLAELFKAGQQIRRVFNENTDICNRLSDKISGLQNEVSALEGRISRLRDDMINDAIDTIDAEIAKLDSSIKTSKEVIEENDAAIRIFEGSIKDLENVSATDHVDKLKASLKAKEEEKKEADRKLAGLQASYNELSEQESRFVNFKTHLANTKINSIAQITNQVLKDTKSPIRVKLSGYTVTKTGKVRDKISISVTKHGIESGSFLKCSAGERARIMFANIVAMHRMTNLTSPSGGLNLICIDEIMDSCEEAGLMSVAEMANQLGITLLMITQGKTSENYPYQIIVTKRLGVSVLKEKYGKDPE